ncbi:hypothetical protein OIDMADRAFT_54932 [Oidiodendron maius Zn]|uniref:Uncharacterized protein n=1 Tax=Oidiodendron maius (strain Zn) TaxID=913774 RepID=A0A0C3HAT1_OIDMZ|nr:hypothetical protein OIDMADRAFT_54932 [Oidiodendron maius Zn]
MAANNPSSMDVDTAGQSKSPLHGPQKAENAQRGGHGRVGCVPTTSYDQFSLNRVHVRMTSTPMVAEDDATEGMEATGDQDTHVQQFSDKNVSSTSHSFIPSGSNSQYVAAQATCRVTPPPVLYDYQVDYVAKVLLAATKLKEAIEELKNKKEVAAISALAADESPYHGSPGFGNPDFGSSPPLSTAMDQSLSVTSVRCSISQGSAQHLKKPETLEDIRRNMAKLLDDNPISDIDYARMNYDRDEVRNHMKLMVDPLKDAIFSIKEGIKEPAKESFLNKRAESFTYAQRKGDDPPSYAYAAPEVTKNGKLVGKNSENSENVAAKAVKDFNKANRDYDDAFERNLRNMSK